jgi:hypothetical protein
MVTHLPFRCANAISNRQMTVFPLPDLLLKLLYGTVVAFARRSLKQRDLLKYRSTQECNVWKGARSAPMGWC